MKAIERLEMSQQIDPKLVQSIVDALKASGVEFIDGTELGLQVRRDDEDDLPTGPLEKARYFAQKYGGMAMREAIKRARERELLGDDLGRRMWEDVARTVQARRQSGSWPDD